MINEEVLQMVETTLEGVTLIKPNVFEDFRGDYVTVYHKVLYESFGMDFVEHSVSISSKNVLRGIHYSPHCWKLFEVLHGSAYYVAVNCEEGHPEFGKWQAFILSDRNHYQLLKHPRYGSAFLTLTDTSVLYYMQSQYYDKNNPDQQTFLWNDSRFDIWWPIKEPILSQRDELGRYV